MTEAGPAKRCEACGAEIPRRPHQDYVLVRACSPGCARTIAYREDPALGGFRWKAELRRQGGIQ